MSEVRVSSTASELARLTNFKATAAGLFERPTEDYTILNPEDESLNRWKKEFG
jgi:hypothetical protein